MHSHLQSAFAFAYATLYSVRPKLAQAAALPAPRLAGRPRYAALLAAAYTLAPVVALVTWRALAPLFPFAAAACAGASLLVLLPPLVHVAHGATRRAAVVFASLLGYLGLGGAVGAALGRALALASCDPESAGECGLTVLGWLLLGGALGALLGYAVHAVRQVRVTSAAQI